MVLYTIVDVNEIMNNSCNEECSEEYSYQNVSGVLLEGRKTTGGTSINRIISTNPKDYLNDAYAPGTMLNK